MISIDRLRQTLHYDKDTGVFKWIRFAGPNAVAGRSAGNVGLNGYVRITVDRKSYLAHRLAWFYVTGSWPKNQVDHIDGTRSNNAFANLREATVSQNSCNSKAPRTNTSGFKGVSWSKISGKWHAYIKTGGKRMNLGLYEDIFEAARVVAEARTAVHGEYANHGVSANQQLRYQVGPRERVPSIFRSIPYGATL